MGVGIMLAASLAVAACSDDSPTDVAADGGVGTGDAASERDSGKSEDSGDTRDSGTTDATDAADAAPLPGVVSDLAAAGETHTSLALTWTAPPDDTGTGTVAGYEIRYATTPIATEADFLAATALEELPDPEAPGTTQTATIHDLAIETEYYVALRATYAGGDHGPLSNVAKGTTKARATLLISEIAPANTGGDFIELVATKAGHAGGLSVSGWMSSLIHTLGPIDVAVGDRIVVHLSGLPGPAGFVQEDESKSKTSSTAANASADAFDVYSQATDLPVVGEVLSVHEPETSDGARWDIAKELNQDVVVYFDRSTAVVDNTVGNLIFGAATMDVLDLWLSPLAAQDLAGLATEGANACDAYVGTVDASGTTTACSGTPAGLTDGKSIQRTGTTDTNTDADFTVKAQTRGAPN